MRHSGPIARTALSVALPDQHARLADGAGAVPGQAGYAGRHSGRRAGPSRRHGVRLDLAVERVADGTGRAGNLARQPRMAQGIRGDAAGLARGGHRGLRICDHRLHRAFGSGRRCRAGPSARAPATARAAADARFRPEPHGHGSPMGRTASGPFRARQRDRLDPIATELHPCHDVSRAYSARLRTRPILLGLAGHACSSTTATRLRRPR